MTAGKDTTDSYVVTAEDKLDFESKRAARQENWSAGGRTKLFRFLYGFALGEHIQAELKKEGESPSHVEGTEQGRWVLLDYVDFVVHLFHPSLRDFYQLERLWSDAQVVPVTAQSVRGS